MNAQIAFVLAFDGHHGDQHNQPFRVIEPAAPTPVALGMGEAGCLEKRFEIVSNIFDPLGVQFGRSYGFWHAKTSFPQKRDDLGDSAPVLCQISYEKTPRPLNYFTCPKVSEDLGFFDVPPSEKKRFLNLFAQ